MELLFSILVGIALSATSGLRLFIPFLIMSLASRAGYLELASGFEWVASTPALIALSAATALEVAAYSIPYVDNILSAVSVPLTAVAGTLLMLSFVMEMDPLISWTLAIIAGGGASMITRLSSNAVHAGSTATTGGLANPFVSLGETLLSIIMAVFAIIFPVLVLVILFILIISVLRKLFFRKTSYSQ